jgi:hypothetical protein
MNLSHIDPKRAKESYIMEDGRMGCWTLNEGWGVFSLSKDTRKYRYEPQPTYNVGIEKNGDKYTNLNDEKNIRDGYDKICINLS